MAPSVTRPPGPPTLGERWQHMTNWSASPSPNRIGVLFVVPSLRRGGAETQLVQLVSAIDRRQFEPHVLTFEAGLDQQEMLRIAPERVVSRPRRHKADFSAIGIARDLIDRQGLAVVHTTLPTATLRGWVGARLSRRRPGVVAAVHAMEYMSFQARLLGAVVTDRILARCAHVIFVCRAQERTWLNRLPRLAGRSSVIYNGIDSHHFSPSPYRASVPETRRAWAVPDGAFIACCIAGLRREKGHDTLFYAFARVRELGHEGVLVLAGDGVLAEPLRRLAKNLGLEGHVRFLGEVNDVRPVLAASDISVMASYSETFSMAILESLAMGVPVIGTKIGGTPEVIRDGITGLLVSQANAAELGDAMVRLARDPVERREMGRRGRVVVGEEFSAASMVASTERLLLETATRDPCA